MTGTHTVTHRGTQDSIKLCIGDGRDMGSQVDINSCTADCTHSKEGVETQAGCQAHTHTPQHRGTSSFHATIHRRLS